MQTSMATKRRANRELRSRAGQCWCHESARGHYWDPLTLRCQNKGCTQTWRGQQESPTECRNPK